MKTVYLRYILYQYIRRVGRVGSTRPKEHGEGLV